ncbi:putative ABC transport system permease protein [Chitinivorax tropicus]|uniref:Putative ABC transport system permease protein n=1 Tax=Chitinivorax tropicus TaxID=714531 RepID=A0A840MRZ3_9PROT|nr:FtsX-like permease family protein [Chitinivorax tropicus]MBB5019542.1 putative ABC transport system permease protein [Chitinivorax tropicus]
MTWLQTGRLAWRMLRRDLRAGELNVLMLALVIAVAAMTSVGFFTDRMQRALTEQANDLLGADLVVSADKPIPPAWQALATGSGLKLAHTTIFPSMVLSGEGTQIASIKAVSAGYPLRGRFLLGTASQVHQAGQIPAAGTLWADERLLLRLNAKIGDQVQLGEASFRIAERIEREPDAAIDIFNFMPRVIINQADLAATQLIQTGSRVRYRLLVAGTGKQVAAFRDAIKPQIGRGQRLETVQDARPEVRNALERAQRFLGLAALSSVALAGVAIGLATRRYIERHLNPVAMMRCLGASQATIFRLFVGQFACLAALAGVAGVAIGFAAQHVLVDMLAGMVDRALPAAHWLPGVQGWLVGALLLFGFAVPPLLQLKKTPTLRVLRREVSGGTRTRAMYLAGGGLLIALLWWQVGEPKLAAYVLSGFVGGIALAAAAGWGLMRLLRRFNRRAGITWRFGVANLYRRQGLAVVQIVALSLGLMALLTLTLVRGDLLQSWQRSVPPDAPNRFIINIQPEQRTTLAQFLQHNQLAAPIQYPMIRGRWVGRNDQPIKGDQYQDEKTKNLAEREFNLSWADRPQVDNQVVAGRFWQPTDQTPQFSVEEGLAEQLGIKLGDRLTFDIAGVRYTAPVTSLRKVNWDSFNVNFFVVAPPTMLANQPTSYITSFRLPADREAVVRDLVRAFPNMTVIDVGNVLREVRDIIGKVAGAVQFVFLFTLVAGLVVLYAALAATQDERRFDNAMLRTLGGSRRQLLHTALAEFASVGALAGAVAVLASGALGWVVCVKLLNLPYQLNPLLPVLGVGGGALAVMLAGLPGVIRLLRTPPLHVLNQSA